MKSGAAILLLGFAVAAPFAPWRRSTWKRPRLGLVFELAALTAGLS